MLFSFFVDLPGFGFRFREGAEFFQCPRVAPWRLPRVDGAREMVTIGSARTDQTPATLRVR